MFSQASSSSAVRNSPLKVYLLGAQGGNKMQYRNLFSAMESPVNCLGVDFSRNIINGQAIHIYDMAGKERMSVIKKMELKRGDAFLLCPTEPNQIRSLLAELTDVDKVKKPIFVILDHAVLTEEGVRIQILHEAAAEGIRVCSAPLSKATALDALQELYRAICTPEAQILQERGQHFELIAERKATISAFFASSQHLMTPALVEIITSYDVDASILPQLKNH